MPRVDIESCALRRQHLPVKVDVTGPYDLGVAPNSEGPDVGSAEGEEASSLQGCILGDDPVGPQVEVLAVDRDRAVAVIENLHRVVTLLTSCVGETQLEHRVVDRDPKVIVPFPHVYTRFIEAVPYQSQSHRIVA